MIAYGFSIQGKSHVKNDVVCQDSNKVGRLKSGYYIGIVADGVGSAPHSDIGSRMAADCLFEYCDIHTKKGQVASELSKILEAGYEYAFSKIEEYAENEDNNIADYDTTLSVALYINDKVIYGHAGDGGIIVKCKDGIIKPITKRQKGADGTSVMPLRAGSSSWEFGVCDEDVVAVMLLTDGMLDGVVQHILVNLPPDVMSMAKGDFKKDNVYVTASEFFMNPYSVYRNKRIKNQKQFMKHFINGDLTKEDQELFFVCINNAYNNMLGKQDGEKASNSIKKYYYAVWAMKNVTDDKTVVCIINDKKKIKPQNLEYYIEPDWIERQKKYNELLYGKTTDKEERSVAEKVKEHSVVAKKEKCTPVVIENEKSVNRVKNIRIVSAATGGVLITLIIAFAIGVLVGRNSNKIPEQVEMVTLQQLPKTILQTETTVNETKVEKQVEEFMDNILKLDSNITEDAKTKFKEKVKTYGLVETIDKIKNPTFDDYSTVVNYEEKSKKMYESNVGSEQLENGTQSESSTQFESSTQSESITCPESISYSESTTWSEDTTYREDIIKNTESTNYTSEESIKKIEKIMKEVEEDNTLSIFERRVEMYLKKCTKNQIKEIKKKINILYPY